MNNKNNRKGIGGRPTKYQEDYARMAYIAGSEVGGFTDYKLGKLFNVSVETIKVWKKTYVEFLTAIKTGKDFWDSLGAEESLLKRVMGYEYTETTREPDENGVMVITKTVTKQVAPDVKACDIWLCNRNSDRWKKLKHVELTGVDGGALIIQVVRFGNETD